MIITVYPARVSRDVVSQMKAARLADSACCHHNNPARLWLFFWCSCKMTCAFQLFFLFVVASTVQYRDTLLCSSALTPAGHLFQTAFVFLLLCVCCLVIICVLACQMNFLSIASCYEACARSASAWSGARTSVTFFFFTLGKCLHEVFICVLWRFSV